jgi:hypothetical protein
MILEREERSLLLDGAPTRRWVSIIAVVIPVGAFVLLAALFIRTYVVPPTYGIPNPMTAADTSPAPAVRAVADAQKPAPTTSGRGPTRSQDLPMMATLAVAPPSPPPPVAVNTEPAQSVAATEPALSAAPTPAAALNPAVPPAPSAVPAPPPTATQSSATVASLDSAAPVAETTGSRREIGVPVIIAGEPAAAAASDNAASPISEPVPLPRHKPHHSMALASRAIPLPRPKPAEEAPESDLPAFDRHTIN